MTNAVFEETDLDVGEIILSDDPISMMKGPQGPSNWGYYRMANGEIVVQQTSPLERMKFTEEGWTFLGQYGVFDMTTGYTASHPFELLFMRGGAKEMSVEQVLANGFHINPPLIPGCGRAINQNHKGHSRECLQRQIRVRFPQLPEGIEGSRCRFCTRVLPSAQARENHEQVAHREERNGIKTADALAAANERSAERTALAVGSAIREGLERTAPAPTAEEPTDVQMLRKALSTLAESGLTKQQKAALEALGVDLAPTEGDANGP